MKAAYREWIADHYPDRRAAVASCASATRKMVEAFPELQRVRGWYGGQAHWWCKTEDGEIVDPTLVQFYSQAAEYVEFDPNLHVEPIGKCVNCGEYCWDRDPETREPLEWFSTSACSPECQAELEAEYRSLLRG